MCTVFSHRSGSVGLHPEPRHERQGRRLALLLFLLFLPGVVWSQTLVVDITVDGLNENQAVAVSQLNDACVNLGNDQSDQAVSLRALCDEIDSLDPEDPVQVGRLQEIAEAVAPEEAFATNDSLTIVSDYQTTNVQARLNALRRSDDTVAIGLQTGEWNRSETRHSAGTSGAGASSDLVSSLNLFLNGSVSSGEIDGAVLQRDADVSSQSLTIGADYRFSENVVLGLGLGVLQDEIRFQHVHGGSTADGMNMTLFASWYESDEGYLDAVLDIGRTDFELERSIATQPGQQLVAEADPAASGTTLTVSAGRYFYPGGWDLGAYGRLSHTRASVDAYTESLQDPGEGFAALFAIEDQDVTSTRIVLGLELSRTVNTTRAVLLPMVRLEYVTENENEKEDVRASLTITDGSSSFRYRGEERDTGYFNLGLGASAVFTNGRSAFAYYETNVQNDTVTQHWLKLGARVEF